MKTKIFSLIFIFISLYGIGNTAYGQVSGDYVATTSGDYNTAANWSVSNGAGGFSGTASSAPTTSINVWIPEGKIMTTTAQANAQNMNISGELNTGNFTVQLGTTSSTTVGNLTITSTGKLRTINATGGTVNSLNIYGNSITVDGQLGAATATNTAAYNAITNPDGGGGFRVYCLAVKSNVTTTVTISGAGKINVARFYGSSLTTASAPQVIDINTDINILNNNSSSIAAFGSIGNTGNSNRTININRDKTVKFTGETPKSSLHRDAVTVGNYSSGDFIYNVYGTLDMGKGTIRLFTSYTSGNTKGAYLNVKDGGTLIVGDTIRLQLGQATGQTCGIFAESGSLVRFGQSAGISTQFRNNIGAAQPPFPSSYFNVDVENPAGISIPNSFLIAGTLNVNQNFTGTTITILPQANVNIANGKTLTANVLNLNSNASGTATLVNKGTTSVTSASVQQYLPDARNWYVSSPVTGAVAQSGYTYYQRDETASSWTSRPFVTDSIFLRGHGYIVLPTAASTLQFNGTLNSGDVNVYLTKSGSGFNLIGNPYPSHLTWTADFVDDLTNAAKIEPTIWIRTNAGNVNNGGNAAWSFLTYNGHSGEAVPLTSILTGGIIPPMQAFWVKAKAAGTLTLDSKLVRSHQSSNPLKVRTAINTGRQRIRMEISDGSTTDETLLYFDGDASDDLDAFDSPKFTETKDVQLYTRAGNENLVINGLNSITDNMLIPLGIITGQSGTFTLKPTQLDNLASGTRVFLVDGSVQTELELNKAYTFSSDATENSSRFSLLFKAPSTTTHSENLMSKPAFNAYRDTNGQLVITVNNAFNTDSKILIYNLSGQKVSESTINGITTVINQPLKAGVYFVTISSAAKNITQKVVIN